MQADSSIVGCLNGGICSDKDDCTCIQTVSVLWKIHKGTKRGMTGWTGTDCSMPVCVQGYYDPFCMDPNAPGGEGCYRCANGGSCTSPDYCACAEGWTGYDCKTPKCEVVTDFLTRKQLDTVDEEKVNYFETDPCTMREITVPRMDKGTEYYRGNCTLPNQCTCHCFWSYIPTMCFTSKENCTAPWQDVNMYLIRSALTPTQVRGGEAARTKPKLRGAKRRAEKARSRDREAKSELTSCCHLQYDFLTRSKTSSFATRRCSAPGTAWTATRGF